MTGFVNRALNFNDNIMSNLIDGNWVLGYNVKISHFSVKVSQFEFVWQAGFSIHNFYCYSAYVLHLFVLKLPENSNYNYKKLLLTCAWFYEKGFKWPEPGYGSNHSSLYSCTMPPKTKGAKWPNWVEVAWKFRNSKIKFFYTLDIYL